MSPESIDSSLATYKQIEVSLRTKIHRGHWPIGAMLPSRRELAREYGVSPITIERAITPLINEGLLRADDRRGTFIAGSPLAPVVPLDRAEPPVDPQSPRGDTLLRPPAYAPVTTATIGIVGSLYVFNHDHLELNNFWVRLLVQSLEHAFAENGHRTRFFNRVQEPGRPLLSLRETLAGVLAEDVDAIAVIGFGMAPQD